MSLARLRELRRDLGFARGVLRRRPFNVLLQLTNRCNMSCPFCGFRDRAVPAQQELSFEDYERLERQLSRLGCFLVSLEGGEPLLRDDLVQLVRLFAKRHVCLLYSNGWFVDGAMARALFGAGLSQVGISIDFADDDRHDQLRGRPGAARRAWQAARLLRDAAPHGGRQVHVMSLLAQETLPELERLLVRSAGLGLGHALTLFSAAGPGRAAGLTPAEAPLSKRLLGLYRRFRHLKSFRGYLAGVDAFLLGGGGLPCCQAGRQSFNVDHLGNVSPCIELLDHAAGNLRQEPLARILQRLRRHPEVDDCQRCWSLCRGFPQMLAGGASASGLWDLATRMGSY